MEESMKHPTENDNSKQRLPKFIDTHCHIDLYQNPKEVLKKADENDIGVIAVTNTPSVFEHMAALVAETRFGQAALGLHPELVGERASELELMWRLFDRTRFIGEIGLDYTNPREAVRQHQREVFS
jgi:TatD DNase family protein